jgi:hypothetical protein
MIYPRIVRRGKFFELPKAQQPQTQNYPTWMRQVFWPKREVLRYARGEFSFAVVSPVPPKVPPQFLRQLRQPWGAFLRTRLYTGRRLYDPGFGQANQGVKEAFFIHQSRF